jgi:hypothetical protein
MWYVLHLVLDILMVSHLIPLDTESVSSSFIILSAVGVTVDGVWIGHWIY